MTDPNLAGIFTDALSGAVAVLIGVTGLFGGAAHYAAVLAMVLRIALAGLPLAAVIALVLLLNSLDAGTGIAVAALGVVAVAGGAALGYFADRLPEFRKAGRRRPDRTGRLAGAHHGHH